MLNSLASIDTDSETKPKDTKPIPDDIKFKTRFELLVYLCKNSPVDAEFWIESEQKRNPKLSRNEAIESAIKITSRLGDKANVFTLVQECISEYLDIEVGQINLDEPLGGEGGVEHIEALELIMNLEEVFNIEISDDTIDEFNILKYEYRSRYRRGQSPGFDPKNIEMFCTLCTGRALLDFMYQQLKELSAEVN